jgi:protein-arginine kinase activator protein McsA
MKEKRCAKCGRRIAYYTLVLMIGERGYRRYPVCGACAAKANSDEYKKSAERRGTPGALAMAVEEEKK